MEKCTIHDNISIPADDQSAIITQPREYPLDFITAFISSHFAAIVMLLFLVIAASWDIVWVIPGNNCRRARKLKSTVCIRLIPI